MSKANSFLGTIEYRYVGFQLCEERDGISQQTSTFAFGDGVDEVYAVRRGQADYFYHADSQGHVLAITDVAGSAVEQYEYDDYGQVLDSATLSILSGPGVTGNVHYFGGRPFDWESQLYYVRARYLDPRLGRFTTRDPLGAWADALSLGNGYTYAGNNPWTYADPSGTTAKKGRRRRGKLSPSMAKARFRAMRREARSVMRDVKSAALEEMRTAAQEKRPPDFSVLQKIVGKAHPELNAKLTLYEEPVRTDLAGTELELYDDLPAFQVSMSFAAEVESPRVNFVPGDPPSNSGSGSSGSGGGDPGGGGVASALAEVVWGVGGMFIPGVGEAQDIAMIFSSESTWVDRTLAGVSLVANVFTAGLAPNYGAAMKTGMGTMALLGAISSRGIRGAKRGKAVLKAAQRALAAGARMNVANLSKVAGAVDAARFERALGRSILDGRTGAKVLRNAVDGFTHELKIRKSPARLLGRVEDGLLIFTKYLPNGFH